jgi:hypothetical protein
MQNPDSSKIIPIPTVKVSESDLIQQLLDENFKLRQIIDEMANTLAMKKELIQQLRDENATLKGQKPKPKISPSKLEGPGSKFDWRKRIAHNNEGKTLSFSLWVNNSLNFDPISEWLFGSTCNRFYIARSFIEEVAELLPVAARVEGQIQADDTGGRHNGHNQYTTIIGNRWFSVFATTDSKSRVNFLKTASVWQRRVCDQLATIIRERALAAANGPPIPLPLSKALSQPDCQPLTG